MAIQLIEENEEGVVFRHGEGLDEQVAIFDWMIRRYFPEEVERLKGDADAIAFTEIHIYSDDVPEVKYSTWNEK